MSGFVKIATLEQVPPGEHKLFFWDEQPVVLFNVDGQIYCLADVCTHDGGTLAEGISSGYEIECPRHGALFDIRTGAALTLPATEPVPVFRVRIENDDILIASA